METKPSTSAANPARPQPSSEPVPQGPLTYKELMARVVVLRQSMSNSPSDVQGKSNKVYVWIGHQPSRIQYYEGLGYRICRDPDVKVNRQWIRSDNTKVRGDLILAEVDKDHYQLLKFEEQLRALEQVDGAKETFKTLAARQGIAIIAEEEKDGR